MLIEAAYYKSKVTNRQDLIKRGNIRIAIFLYIQKILRLHYVKVKSHCYIQIMEPNCEQVKGSNKINYRQKNLDYIQKIKEKKQREIEQKLLMEKKQQQRREFLKKKVLQQATKNRENKLRELKDIQNTADQTKSRKNRTGTNFQSLPKIPTEKEKEVQEQNFEKKKYQQRYLTFLQSLHQNNKSKKEIQETEAKKKEEKMKKLKQDLGYTNVDSKLGITKLKKQKSENMEASEQCELVRSQSADKFQSLIQIAENQLPKTNKNFKRKNEQYIEKIKRKRAEEQQQKEEQRKKKERLKQKLKDYVMVTVKKNVLDGVYDDELEKKGKKTMKQSQDQEQNQDQEESQEDQDKTEVKKKKRKMRSFPHVTDLTEWKKKNRLEQADKVFIITGGYGDLKKALKDRGWVQNPDYSSPCFDLKFTLQIKEIDFDHLQDFQMTNHFQKNGVITTKLGLTKTLRNSVWVNDISQDTYFPKCFDLNDEDDYVAFQTHFKVCKALSILKIYADSAKNRQDQKFKKDKNLLEDLKLRTEVAISVCLKNIEQLDQIIDKKKIPKIVTEKQWQILGSDELSEEGLAKKKHQQWLKSIDCKFGGSNLGKKVEKQKKKKKKKEQKQDEIEVAENQNEQEEASDQLMDKVEQILQEYKKRFPQFHLTHHNNIWILKPAGLSRGRGITCYNNFVQIQDHIRCKQSLWIAQKYIENPLVILKRKFDIRQWVLITDFNPLVIWLYDECYVRFSAIDYDAKQVNNKFIHLTNNSIGAYYKDFDKSHIKGNMFYQEDLQNYLKAQQNADIFQEKIRPQMKEIVKQSMLCALDGIQNRKNTHEMYGYDFMIDESYKVWLIEINSSPSMDYSTHVTSRLVKEVLTDLPKVIIDHANAPKKEKKNVDTGKWKRIYKGVEVSQKIASAGLNLCLQGIPMKKSKRPTVKVQNFNIEK